MNWLHVLQMEIPFCLLSLLRVCRSEIGRLGENDLSFRLLMLVTRDPSILGVASMTLLVVPMVLEALGQATSWWLFLVQETACLWSLQLPAQDRDLQDKIFSLANVLATACLPLYVHLSWAWAPLLLLPLSVAFGLKSDDRKKKDEKWVVARKVQREEWIVAPLVMGLAVGLPYFLQKNLVLAPWPMANLNIATYVHVALDNISHETHVV